MEREATKKIVSGVIGFIVRTVLSRKTEPEPEEHPALQNLPPEKVEKVKALLEAIKAAKEEMRDKEEHMPRTDEDYKNLYKDGITADRPTCTDCVKNKHLPQAAVALDKYRSPKKYGGSKEARAMTGLSQAEITLGESVQGYPKHYWLAMGHMAEASDELAMDYPDQANMIREERKKLEADPKYKPNFEVLVGKISEECTGCKIGAAVNRELKKRTPEKVINKKSKIAPV